MAYAARHAPTLIGPAFSARRKASAKRACPAGAIKFALSSADSIALCNALVSACEAPIAHVSAKASAPQADVRGRAKR
jgi:hypothetical protein